MYLFSRRVLRADFWASAIVAWCYPLTGFFIFWQGNVVSSTINWLPWILLAVYQTARGGRAAPAWLALSTALVLVTGQLDVAGLVLVVSGLFGLWCLGNSYRALSRRRRLVRVVLALVAGWGLGFMLAAPNILPTVQYLHTGHRMAQRFEGKQERPPVGLVALPQVILPDMYGSTETGSFPLLSLLNESNLPESTSAAYAGVLATLVAAPLAWCRRRHRAMNLFWVALAVLGISWCLDLPVFVDLMGLPIANMLSYDRLVFASAFAILAMAAIGLDVLSKRPFAWRPAFWLPAALLLALCLWCSHQAVTLPGLLPDQIEAASGKARWIENAGDVKLAQAWFALHYQASAIWCGMGVLLWLALRFRLLKPVILVSIFGVLLLGELLWFSHGRAFEADPALYYPEIRALRSLAAAPPGRVIGLQCLPANLATAVGLSDVRGYDAVDPERWVSLLAIGADPRSTALDYSATQLLIPRLLGVTTNAVILSPVYDLLDVRYVIFRRSPPPEVKPLFQSPDYWVMENPRALPRVFIPKHVEVVPDDLERLGKLSEETFNPREVAYVETPVELPAECNGTVKIRDEVPTRISVAAQMQTAGLLVLSDLWDAGWSATVNGQQAPILRTDHAIRGVVLPPGSSEIEFRYRPASLRTGLMLAGTASLILLGWSLSLHFFKRP